MTATLEDCFRETTPNVRALLEGCLNDRPLAWQDAVTLSSARGRDLHALATVADEMRKRQAGDTVTYVVNRNINFTNVCTKACRFCAFSRTQKSTEGYLLPVEEIVRRALEARSLGATEVCIQAGLLPDMNGRLYIELCQAIKKAAPDLHIHAFSPEEIKYGATLLGLSFREFLIALKEAGLDTLPGTSAEILDDELRRTISPGRITTAEWREVITSAHEVGLPTTSTIMFGHLETDAQRMKHLDLLRTIQSETHGFTEFVPLSFVHHEAPMFLKHLSPALRSGPTGNDVVRLYAIARLMLGPTFKNIQASWVKEGLRDAQWLLNCGVNDLGGTLINESISTSAGSANGQFMAPSTLRRAIRDAGRPPAERNTKYKILKTWSLDGGDDVLEPLDRVEDPDATFGTYAALTRESRFRFTLARPEL